MSSDLLDPFKLVWFSLLPEVYVHVIPFHVLDEVVELEGLLLFVVFLHEVLIPHYIRMEQVFGKNKFTKHLLASLLGKNLVVVNLPSLVNVLSFYANQSYLVHISLSARP